MIFRRISRDWHNGGVATSCPLQTHPHPAPRYSPSTIIDIIITILRQRQRKKYPKIQNISKLIPIPHQDTLLPALLISTIFLRQR